MYKKIVALSLLTSNLIIAQNLGVNATGTNAHPSALLDADAAPTNNKGILIPRIALQATNISNPVTAPATSLLVYNTATASSGTTAVVPGYYYWDGVKWLRLANGLAANDSQSLTVNGSTLSISNGNSLVIPCTCTNSAISPPIHWVGQAVFSDPPLSYTTYPSLNTNSVTALTDNNTSTTYELTEFGYAHLGFQFANPTQLQSITINSTSYVPFFTDLSSDCILYGSFDGVNWTNIPVTYFPNNLSPVETIYVGSNIPFIYYLWRVDICNHCTHIINGITFQ